MLRVPASGNDDIKHKTVMDAVQTKRHLDHAQGYLMLKMYDDALKEVDEVLAACPEHKDSLYWKGLIYLDQHKFTEAEPPLRRLIEIDAEQAHVYVHLAYIYRRTVSLERAIETIQQALQLSPKMPIGLYNLACYRAVQGQPTEALKLLSQAVTLSKEYRKLALTDPDFESVRGTEEFRKLIEN